MAAVHARSGIFGNNLCTRAFVVIPIRKGGKGYIRVDVAEGGSRDSTLEEHSALVNTGNVVVRS